MDILEQKSIVEFKQEIPDDNFSVEYEIVPYIKKEQNSDIYALDQRISSIDTEIEKLNSEIDRLTNHADGLDYIVAVSSGILSGIIDSIFVGEWNFEHAKAISNEEINRKVMAFAKKKGWQPHEGNGERLDLAIKYLEKKYPLPGDGAFEQLAGSGITKNTHHIDDFCHHPNIVGLICCLLVQFKGETIYYNNSSTKYSIPILVNDYGQLQGTTLVTKFFCGIINWFITVAKTIANAKGHWMSDIAGSGTSKHGGAGLPGPVMSLLKELSALPCFKDSNFSENLRKVYQNGIGTGKKQIDLGILNSLFEGASSKFDIRTENALKHELKRQAVPVVINEALVRGFYTIRHFIAEYKLKNDFYKLDWKNILPFKNRTIIRMLTISTGTFTAFDLADATIRSAVKNAGQIGSPLFIKDIILRVNFVGIGRFAIAISTDVSMEVKKSTLEYKRIELFIEQNELLNAKIFYRQQEMWIQIANTESSAKKLLKIAEQSIQFEKEAYKDMLQSVNNIGIYAKKAEEKNPGLRKKLLDSMW